MTAQQPTLTREGLAVALLGLLSNIPGIVTADRRLRHWTDVPAEERPAIFLSTGNQKAKQDASGAPAVWTFNYTVDLYVYSEDPALTPSTMLNQYVDAIEAALKPAAPWGPPGYPGTVQVLGDQTGRIRHAWVLDVETDEGVLGTTAIASIRLEIQLT